jgi:hypothetical protein
VIERSTKRQRRTAALLKDRSYPDRLAIDGAVELEVDGSITPEPPTANHETVGSEVA